jgi:DNA-binding PadR family transcriptional regulator
MYGYEIAAIVHAETNGTFTWREGSLYPCLHKMEADGWITGKWEEKETGRKRRYYHLTKKGRDALRVKQLSWAELCKAVNAILGKDHGSD